ncbi:T9SS-dependent choice-of-anchor J family protein [Cesiribacter andamanensis]|uniref:Zinc-dependent metalloproteinase lipoprotein, family n=1 Tax=Cesiribacter andamanensis AMV16 TaxID=1279009 RepID=M7N1M5_9BACT|nr:choice-of-anchor J domain-containing protein [Cesiribacter andamanensis]EMR02588.1 zinc-dependent metalloproteinase lipoprotein, family [Cesiribacter andamanensis AMV16]
MRNLLLLILVISSFLSPVSAQHFSTSTSNLTGNVLDPIDTGELIRCYTVEYHNLRKSKDLSIPGTQDFEKVMAAQIEAAKADPANNGILKGVLQIPVVVHVVHFGEPVGTGANIAAEQIYSQLEVMNEDFRRMMGTRGFNEDSRGADTQIEFVPALVDPEGNLLPEPGIHRYQGPLPAYVLEEIDLLIKPATIYDPNRYLNMWTVRFAALLLGYAQFPDPAHGFASGLGCDTGGAQTDGVVMGFDAFGSSEKYPQGTYNAPYDLGRTVTHEVGHWLGLRHIWGDGGCGVDDFCGDTPESDASNSGCNPSDISCGSVDMVQNYMDYTYDACMNIFTNDQTLRMRTVLTKSPRRRELLSSTVHLQPVALDAAIIEIVSPTGQRCGGNILPEVLLRNLGQQILTSVAIHYQLGSGSVQTFQWTGSLATGEIESVTLPAISAPDGTHTFTVRTAAPNGGSDARTFNDSWSDSFIISNVGERLDFLETFESGLYPPSNKWQLDNADRCESWSPYSNLTGADGQASTAVFMNYYEYDAKGTTDALQLPLIDLSTTEDSHLEFDVAYATSSANDKLEVQVSVDCGRSFKTIYSKAGAELATAPAAEGAFYPTAGDWRRERLSLNNYRSGQLLIKFVGTNDYGNNLYLDNIFVSGASPEAAPVQLKKFTAAATTEGVELQWLTASEENYESFILERSADGSSFEPIAQLPAKKKNSTGASYKQLDTDPLTATAYYRLQILRSSGLNALYSQTISIKGNNSSTKARTGSITATENGLFRLRGLYPNPSHGTFALQYEAKKAGPLQIQLINMLGQVLHEQPASCQQGQNQTTVHTSGLAKGLYYVLLHTPDGTLKEKVLLHD